VADLAVDDMSMISPTWRALGQVVLVYFAFGSAAVTAQDSQPGRATFAEMIAFARLASVACQRLAPDADSFHAVALRRLIKPPLTEEEIAAKEKDVKRLRVRLGLSRWCKRYASVMEQARILVQVLRKRSAAWADLAADGAAPTVEIDIDALRRDGLIHARQTRVAFPKSSIS
jgi:hypothetical protein